MAPQIFRRGKEFYCNLENEIAQAQKEILINVYSFQNDTVGKRFTEILKRKLKEGVTVRVILDGLGSRHDGREIADELTKYGGEVRIFRTRKNYLRRHPVIFCRRDHARIFLIDRKVLGIGGICIGNIYDDRQDLAVLIPVTNADPIVSYFNELWALGVNKNGAEPPHDFGQPLPVSPAVQALVSTPIQEEQMIYRWAMEHIRSAKKRIVIVAAWFLPTIEIIRELCSAEERGVAITIVTPSHTDKRWYDDFRGGAISRLLKKNIAWYGTGEYFHQKYFLIDDDWCLGSANFDMISMNRNYELNICGSDGTIIQELESNFAMLVRGGEPIRRARINFLVRFLEKIAYPIFEAFIVTRR